mmetsp:Transcript_6417/g.22602  ORF Transcript_6417/g.22602 Transcript_6417/m.22602 type:complete len:1664 (+) Transcript_6417:339-5330(+)
MADTEKAAVAGSAKELEELTKGMEPRSLYLMTLKNPFRIFIIRIIKSKMFDRFILTLILLNCVFLAMGSNYRGFESTPRGQAIFYSEYIFMVLFAIEMVLKIIGLGFYIGKGTYLKDNWNILDFIVVVLGFLSMTPAVANVSAIRTVRVLRPLRTITGVEGMRVLVLTLLKSLPMLLDVLVLVSFAFFIFGIVGVQLFAGKMDKRCSIPTPDPRLETDFNADGCYLCQGGADTPGCDYDACLAWKANDMLNWTIVDGMEDTLCAGPMLSKFPRRKKSPDGFNCPEDSWCVKDENPNFNITSFDHILWAWLTIFQCISLEGWTDVMYWVQDGVSSQVWIYFVIMIIFGSFFAVNLALAVLYVYFTNSDEEEDEDPEATREEGGEAGDAAAAAPAAKDKTDAQEKPADATKETEGTPVPVQSSNKFVQICQDLSFSPKFEALTMFLIIFNTVIMSSVHYPTPQTMSDVYEIINYCLSAYFGAEMIIKLVGLGFHGYCEDRMNVFDGTVVIFSFVEITYNEISGGGGGFLSVLRSFRLLRVFKLARQWKELNKIISTIFKSLASISYLSLILLLFIFIFSLLGMQLFGYAFVYCDETGVDGAGDMCPDGAIDCPKHEDCYVYCSPPELNSWVTYPGSAVHGGMCLKYDEKDDGSYKLLARISKSAYPRHNFDDIYWSFITIFQILTGENWNTVMYDGMRSTSWLAAFYFLLLVVVGNYIILNLFLAILLDNFAAGDDDEEEEEEGSTDEPKPSINTYIHGEGKGAEGEDTSAPRKVSSMRSLASPSSKEVKPVSPRPTVVIELENRSLFVMGPKNPFRIAVARVVMDPRFDHFIIALICLSSLCLAIDSPDLDEDSDLKKALNNIDTVFVICFVIEMVMKVLVYGFVLHDGAYLRNSWNVLDFLIVLVGLIGLTSSGDDLEALKALRTFRALRPIRVAARAEGMKVVVNALFSAIPGIANVTLVCMLFYLIFGILGLNLFLGAFWACKNEDDEIIDPDIYGMNLTGESIDKDWCDLGHHWVMCPAQSNPQLVGPRTYVGDWTCTEVTAPSVYFNEYYMRYEAYSGLNWECTNGAETVQSYCEPYMLEHSWKNPGTYSFDNIGASILALFEMATLEMWLDVMYSGVDAVGIEKQPIRDKDPFACLFFVFFIVVGSFFVMNLFVGVTIDKFNEMKEKQEGRSVFLTKEQQSWVSIQKLMAGIKPQRNLSEPEDPNRRAVFHIVMDDRFDAFILSMILLNVFFMALTHANMTDAWVNALFIANTLFAAIFLMEAVLKLYALGYRDYFKDNWNRFDFTTVLLAIVGFIITVGSDSSASYLSMLRIFRVARIFRLIPKAKGLRTLFETLMFSMPALVNVGSVLLLFFFIFAIMGMNLFGRIKDDDNFITRHANFGDFPNSFMLLFRMATGESWNGIMWDCMVTSQCIEVHEDALPDSVKIANDIPLGTNWYIGKSDKGSGTIYDGVDGDKMENRCSPHPSVAILYFFIFVILCAFVMLNLVIAVIIDNFQNSNSSEDAPVGRDDFIRFVEVWSKLDPSATYYVAASKLQFMLAELDPPLGIRGSGLGKTTIQQIIMDVDIPNHGGRIHFLETLHALSGRVAYTDLPDDEQEKLRQKMSDRLPILTDGETKYTAAHYHAALYVQAAVRGFLARYQMRSKLASVDGQDAGGLA